MNRRKRGMTVSRSGNLLVSNILNWTCSDPQFWGELSCRLDLQFEGGCFTLNLVNETEDVLATAEIPIENIMRQFAEVGDFSMTHDEQVQAKIDGIGTDYRPTKHEFGTIDWKGVGGSSEEDMLGGEEPEGYPTRP